MTRINVKGIHRINRKLADGSAVEYHYCWRGGPRFWKTGDCPKFGPSYWKAYNDAVQAKDPSAGTFRELVRRFLTSREFADYASRTKKDFQRFIFMDGGIDDKFGSAPLGAFNDPAIRRIVYDWRDRMSSDRTADAAKGALVRIVNWGIDRNYLRVNHLANMTARYSADRSDMIWTNAEIEAFCADAPEYLRRAIIAMSETGLRPGDLVRLSRSHVEGGAPNRRIVMRTAKRRRMVSIPVTPNMARVIDETPADRLLILVGERGRPYKSASGLSRQVTRWKAKLIAEAEAAGDPPPIRKDLHLYDLRGTAATRLFEADATLREIALYMGWSISTAARMIETYVAQNAEGSDSLLVKLSDLGR